MIKKMLFAGIFLILIVGFVGVVSAYGSEKIDEKKIKKIEKKIEKIKKRIEKVENKILKAEKIRKVKMLERNLVRLWKMLERLEDKLEKLTGSGDETAEFTCEVSDNNDVLSAHCWPDVPDNSDNGKEKPVIFK